MKFSQRTIQLLRNFSTIEESIMFKQGSTIATRSKSKSILARAKIDSTIEQQFAIAELGHFLSALSMFTDPELQPEDKWLKISEGKSKLNYVYSDPDCVIIAPDKDVTLPTVDVVFDLKSDVLARLIKALAITNAPMISVRGDKQTIYLETIDPKNPTKSTYSVSVGETEKKFQLIFAAENIKLIQDDYHVEICSRGISHFTGTDVEYWIALEQNSTFEG